MVTSLKERMFLDLAVAEPAERVITNPLGPRTMENTWAKLESVAEDLRNVKYEPSWPKASLKA